MKHPAGRLAGFIGVALLFALGSAMAQSRPAAVPAAGTVLDPRGSPVAEAAVRLKDHSGKTVSSVKTDAAGKFRFASVAEGSYSVVVQAEGFELAEVPLQVTAQLPAPISISLSLAQVVTEVSVNGEAPTEVSTDVSDNRDTASAGGNLLEKVPVFDQDYVAAMSTFLDPGSLGTNGPDLMVNGMSATTVPVSASAIQEVRINQNPYSAEIARPGRGTIEIITKDAISEFHGTINFIFRDSSMNARDAFALVKPPEQRRIFEGAMTGPIFGSKSTSFLLSGHRQEEDLQSIVDAQGPSGPINETTPSPKRDSQISLRIGHQFSASHAIYVQGNEWEYPSINQGVGGFVLPEAGYDSKQWEREIIFNDRWAPSATWLLQFQILFGWEHHDNYSVSSAPKIVVQDAFTSGGAQVDLLNTERHVQLNEIVSRSAGKHFVKFGLNVPDISQRGIVNHSNSGGTYSFADLASYEAQIPSTFKEQQGSGTVRYTQKELGLFVQDEYRVRPNFSVSLGLRYNWQNYLRDNTQFAPRLAFAFSPGKHPKTVFRGGAGIFYDRTGPGAIGDMLFYNSQLIASYTIDGPGYPSPGPLGVRPVDIVQFDPTMHEPYTIQYSFGVERQLAKRTTLAVTYYGSVGVSLFRSRDINALLPPTYTVAPDPALGVIRNIESSGRQIGNSLEVTLRGDLTRRFTGLIQYTLSRTDNNTGGITWFPANQYDLSGEWSRADFDQRHRLNLLESFNPGKSFTLGIGLAIASGKPYSEITGSDAPLANGPSYGTGLTNARPPGVPRNSLEGLAYADLDLRLSRDFFLNREKKDMGKVFTMALDAFNVLNHVNFVSYDGNINSPVFGQAVADYPTRRLQITTRFKF